MFCVCGADFLSIIAHSLHKIALVQSIIFSTRL